MPKVGKARQIWIRYIAQDTYPLCGLSCLIRDTPVSLWACQTEMEVMASDEGSSGAGHENEPKLLVFYVGLPVIPGIYLLLNYIHHVCEFAEEFILLGALLTPLSGGAALFAIEQQLRRAAFARHMRHSSHMPGKSISQLRTANTGDEEEREVRARHLTLS